MKKSKTLVGGAFAILLAACSSAPKTSQEKISQEEAKAFFERYCSRISGDHQADRELSGDMVVRSSTREFKGQYPASIHFSKDNQFSLEVTNIIGGTVVLLKGDPSSVEIFSPGRPQYNRKGIRQYMGLSIPIFMQLLHGDVPCPDTTSAKVEGSLMTVTDKALEWKFERSDSASDSVPVRIRIFEGGQVKVEMVIEDWNQSELYAEKVRVRTPEGDLRWTWRSRTLK